MDRALRRYGYLLFLGLLVAMGGCANMLATVFYVVKGNETDPEFSGLKGKKVAVVCRPLVALKYQDSRVAKDLAGEIGKLLKQNGKKIQVVEARKVERWIDENTWEEYSEVGKALDAEMVVGVDLESFTIYQGQTLYQGRANVTLHVIDCKGDGKGKDKGKDSETVFEKSMPEVVYPPNFCIQTSEKQEAQFRREFIHMLGNHIGRHFYPYEAHADVAQDAVAGL